VNRRWIRSNQHRKPTRPWQRAFAVWVGLLFIVFLGLGEASPARSGALWQAEGSAPQRVLVVLRAQADLGSLAVLPRAERLEGLVRRLQAEAERSQPPLVAWLEGEIQAGRAADVTPLWIINALAVTASPETIAQIWRRPDVRAVRPVLALVLAGPPEPPAPVLQAAAVETPAPHVNQPSAPPEANIERIEAPALWALGWRGQGVTVANLDTGVSLDHPDLVNNWRGGDNSWYDPFNQHPDLPTDLAGHGTATMSLITGGDAGGTIIGVAPQARWIAARIFNDSGLGTTEAAHLAFQWLLDPDGDPSTPDAPQVVNNSWDFESAACNPEFRPDLQVLLQAGILPLFAAGNLGPLPASAPSPANYPESLAVGAVTLTDANYTQSSRGPSSCEEPETIFPELAAPGVNIRVAWLHKTYTRSSGTSLAAPHAAGVLALLLGAYPDLTPDQQAQALMASAVDIAGQGPDNDTGWGRLNAAAAYDWLVENIGPPPPPTETPTPTPTPTHTPTPTPIPERRYYFPWLPRQHLYPTPPPIPRPD